MGKRKNIKKRGKIKFSEYFKELSAGDRVALVKEPTVTTVGFHKRMQGRTGIVEGRRGRSYIVKVKDLNMEKTIIVQPIHLKRIKSEAGSKE